MIKSAGRSTRRLLWQKAKRSCRVDGHCWYVSAPMRDIMYRWSWIDESGETVHWPGGEHAVVICGYDDTSITYRDPNAGTTVVIDFDTFEKSFYEFGGRIVFYTDDV